jgi:TetR/AcrR family transcriptional repressor of nem operon
LAAIMNETMVRVMDAAESGIRLRGYHAVSFRELADELGIKSSSVHYYFRQKEDMGVALVKRYSDRFFADLEEKTVGARTPEDRLRAFCNAYRDALKQSDKICLCGMLGTESCGLPVVLADAVAAFFEANLAWVGDALPMELGLTERQARATQVLATLQGAMMIATSLKNHALFDDVARSLLAGHSK